MKDVFSLPLDSCDQAAQTWPRRKFSPLLVVVKWLSTELEERSYKNRQRSAGCSNRVGYEDKASSPSVEGQAGWLVSSLS